MSAAAAAAMACVFRRRKAKATSIFPMMDSGDLLQIQPRQLQFPFELGKQMVCSLRLTNRFGFHVAFKVKTTNVNNYSVKPCLGVVMPHSTLAVIVTMQAQKEAPVDMQCSDKFLIQSIAVCPCISVTDEMFDQESLRYQIDECRLTVAYVEQAGSSSDQSDDTLNHQQPPSHFNMVNDSPVAIEDY